MKQKITKGKVVQTCIIVAGLVMAGGVGFQFHENQGLTKDLNTLKENHIETVQQLKTASENAKKIEQLNKALTAKTDKLSNTVEQLKKDKEAADSENEELSGEKDALQQANEKLKEQLKKENDFPRRVSNTEENTPTRQTTHSETQKNTTQEKKELTTSKQSPENNITTISEKSQEPAPIKETVQKPSQTVKIEKETYVPKKVTEPSTESTRTLKGVASAYTLNEPGVTGQTASGKTVRPGMIAMDGSIPMGTKVRITCPDYPSINGIYTVEDRGGAISGNRVDIYMTSLDHANNFGKRNITIEILK